MYGRVLVKKLFFYYVTNLLADTTLNQGSSNYFIRRAIYKYDMFFVGQNNISPYRFKL